MYAPELYLPEGIEPVAHGRILTRTTGRQAEMKTLKGNGRAMQSALVATNVMQQTTTVAVSAAMWGMAGSAAIPSAASAAFECSADRRQMAKSAHSDAELDGCPCRKKKVGEGAEGCLQKDDHKVKLRAEKRMESKALRTKR